MDMLDFTREHTASVESSSLNDVVAEVCLAAAKDPEVQNKVDLAWNLDEAIPLIMINRKAIYNAVMNLGSSDFLMGKLLVYNGSKGGLGPCKILNFTVTFWELRHRGRWKGLGWI
jgi:hypothetical protein